MLSNLMNVKLNFYLRPLNLIKRDFFKQIDTKAGHRTSEMEMIMEPIVVNGSNNQAN